VARDGTGATRAAALVSGSELERAHGGLPWRSAAWLFVSSSTQAGVAFASNLVLVRFVAPEGFGRFALALATLSLVFAFGSLRPGQLAIRDQYSLTPERRAFLWNACWQEALYLSAGAALVLACCAPAAFDWALLAAVGLGHFGSQARGFLERSGAYRALSLIEGGAHLLAHCAAVGAALLGAGLWALVVREVLLALVQIVALASTGGLPRAKVALLVPRQWRALAREAKDLWSDGVLESLHARLVVLAAGWIGGVRGAGLFFQAQRLALVPHQFLQPIAGRLAFSWFARATDESEVVQRRATLLTWLCVPLLVSVGVCLAFSGDIVPLVLGESWAASAPLLASLAGVAGGTSLLAVVNMELLARRRFDALLAMRVAQYAGLVAAPVLLFALPQLGLEALGLALGLGCAAGVVTGLRVRSRARAVVPAAHAAALTTS
jgi:O-antigen/teichoic acid export membrane protein